MTREYFGTKFHFLLRLTLGLDLRFVAKLGDMTVDQALESVDGRGIKDRLLDQLGIRVFIFLPCFLLLWILLLIVGTQML